MMSRINATSVGFLGILALMVLIGSPGIAQDRGTRTDDPPHNRARTSQRGSKEKPRIVRSTTVRITEPDAVLKQITVRRSEGPRLEKKSLRQATEALGKATSAMHRALAAAGVTKKDCVEIMTGRYNDPGQLSHRGCGRADSRLIRPGAGRPVVRVRPDRKPSLRATARPN